MFSSSFAPVRRYVGILCLALAMMVPAVAGAQVALWRITGPQGHSAHLMGSVHMLPSGTRWQSPQLKKLVKQADALLLEAEMTSAAAAQVRNYALTFGFAHSARMHLPHRIGRTQLSQLRAVEKRLDLPEGVFDQMTPWYAALNLSTAHVMTFGINPNAGVESWLNTYFRRRLRHVGGLEPAQAGIAAMALPDVRAQLKILNDTLGEITGGEGDPRALITCWLAGDMACVEAHVLKDMDGRDTFYQRVLVDRNASWVEPILAALATPEREFIAVGAAHLAGPDSLLTMLEGAGIQVTRIN